MRKPEPITGPPRSPSEGRYRPRDPHPERRAEGFGNPGPPDRGERFCYPVRSARPWRMPPISGREAVRSGGNRQCHVVVVGICRFGPVTAVPCRAEGRVVVAGVDPVSPPSARHPSLPGCRPGGGAGYCPRVRSANGRAVYCHSRVMPGSSHIGCPSPLVEACLVQEGRPRREHVGSFQNVTCAARSPPVACGRGRGRGVRGQRGPVRSFASRAPAAVCCGRRADAVPAGGSGSHAVSGAGALPLS